MNAKQSNDTQEDYAGMSFDDALRRLLSEFKLPGEAQQIDRIMEKFAEAYCRCNAGTFSFADDAYRLAFAVINGRMKMTRTEATTLVSADGGNAPE